jgi:hypothetical protein
MHSERKALSTNTTIQQRKALPVNGQGRTTRISSSVVIFGCVPKNCVIENERTSFESGGMQREVD